MKTRKFISAVLATLLLCSTGALRAQAQSDSVSAAIEAAARAPGATTQPFGVPLAPPIYLINFLLLYFSNPDSAAYMPAYKADIPEEVYLCLLEHPDGCPYEEMARYFAKQAHSRAPRGTSVWPASCQTTPPWRLLAAPQYQLPSQINQPLGRVKAAQLARALGITRDMVLTPTEYQCLIGQPPREPAQEIIAACMSDLTNSKGNATIPLSSYGLSLDAARNVRADCAPHAPCLEFNKLFAGPLEEIAARCGFGDKLARLVRDTPFVLFAQQGGACQDAWLPSCIVEAPARVVRIPGLD